jgi:hypothetical protein
VRKNAAEARMWRRKLAQAKQAAAQPGTQPGTQPDLGSKPLSKKSNAD